MNLEARPWLVDFYAAAALDSFPFSDFFSLGCFWYFLHLEMWVFLLGLFLVFSEL